MGGRSLKRSGSRMVCGIVGLVTTMESASTFGTIAGILLPRIGEVAVSYTF